MLKKSWPKANDALCLDLGTLEMIIPKQVGVMAEPRKKRTQRPAAKVIGSKRKKRATPAKEAKMPKTLQISRACT